MAFNKYLCRAIAESGFAFEDVAIFADMLSPNLIRFVKNGEIPSPGLQQRLAEVLGKRVEDLWPPEE
jgi:hypothetical protein